MWQHLSASLPAGQQPLYTTQVPAPSDRWYSARGGVAGRPPVHGTAAPCRACRQWSNRSTVPLWPATPFSTDLLPMTVDDAYDELGLPPGANLAQAKAAWRGLVSRWHPDRNDHVGASARMQRINRALEQIRLASQGEHAKTRQARGDAGAPAAVRTVQHHVKLTLEESASGCIRVLQGSLIETCAVCAGKGHRQEPKDCATCAGKGHIHERTWFGWYGVATPCTDCDGTGVVQDSCVACKGRGKTEVTSYRQSVRLPAHLRNGDVLHVPAGRARAAVALDIHVEVLPHACLVRDDNDGTVRCEFVVDAFGWIANRTIDVPTLRGLQPLQLQRGQVVYRLAGQGFPPRSGGTPADQIVIIVPRFPAQLSPRQERLLEHLADSSSALGDGARRGD